MFWTITSWHGKKKLKWVTEGLPRSLVIVVNSWVLMRFGWLRRSDEPSFYLEPHNNLVIWDPKALCEWGSLDYVRQTLRLAYNILHIWGGRIGHILPIPESKPILELWYCAKSWPSVCEDSWTQQIDYKLRATILGCAVCGEGKLFSQTICHHGPCYDVILTWARIIYKHFSFW